MSVIQQDVEEPFLPGTLLIPPSEPTARGVHPDLGTVPVCQGSQEGPGERLLGEKRPRGS